MDEAPVCAPLQGKSAMSWLARPECLQGMRTVRRFQQGPQETSPGHGEMYIPGRSFQETAYEHFIKKGKMQPHSWLGICSQRWPWASSIGWRPEEQWGLNLSVRCVFEVFFEPCLPEMPGSVQNDLFGEYDAVGSPP